MASERKLSFAAERLIFYGRATMMRATAAILMASLCVALHGCETSPTGLGNSRNKVSAYAAPATFLRTGYRPLEAWLSKRFDVTYRNMRLGGTERENIFAQQPLTEIHYQFESVGRSGSLFHLRAENISRREILYRIARDYGLRMTVENVNGKPAYVRVIGNDPGSRFNPGEVIADEGSIREL